MTRELRVYRAAALVSAALAGAAIGAAAQAGGALLLYTGEGLLAAAAFLLALVLAALGAGLWVGGPASGSTRGRWIATVAAYVIAAFFASLWTTVPQVREPGFGRALAVLLFLAEPAYLTGSLLASLQARRRRWLPLSETGALPLVALIGAALGVLASAVVLIPRFAPGTVFMACAFAATVAGFVEMRMTPSTASKEPPNMRGKVVIVTGVGARGQVGYALAKAFLEQGCRVVMTGRTAAVEDLAAELGGEPDVVAVRANLATPEGAEAVVAAARERFGRLDVLVNVAGGLSVIGTVEETSLEEWREEFDRNATTAFLMSRAALPLLRESRGSIINFASPAAEKASATLAAYSAAKAGVLALTQALAREERQYGVRVNAVAPGMIDTEQNRETVQDPASVTWVGRDEIARVVLFLASDDASAITGEMIHVLGV